MKTLTELKAGLAGKLDQLEDIRAQFADSREKEVQHYLTWGDGKGYFDIDRCLNIALKHYTTAAPPAGCRVLDIGAGFGWFGYVCRQHGHDVLCADVAHGHCGGKRKSPDCAALFQAVNNALGNTTTEIEPIRAGQSVECRVSGAGFDLVTLLGTVFDTNWSIADYEFLWRDLQKFLAPHGKIYAQSNVSKFRAAGLDAAKAGRLEGDASIVLITAANHTYRPIVARWLRHAEALGYPAIVYDLGGLGLGEHWTVADEPFQRAGHYWRTPTGWPTKGLHKPEIIAHALELFKQKKTEKTEHETASVPSCPTLLLYLDADALPIDNLDALTKIEFDVAVTERPPHELAKRGAQRYGEFYGRLNAGVIAFRPGPNAAHFVDIWKAHTECERNDQKALNKMMGSATVPVANECVPHEKSKLLDRDDLAGDRDGRAPHLLRLSADWNWPYACSKAKDQPPGSWIPPQAKILHFKSRRWEPFAERHPTLDPRHPSHVTLPEWDRTELIRRLPRKAIGAEIGVLTGRFSEVLLKLTAPRRLHLIDAWAPAPDNHDKSREGGPVDHERNYLMTRVRVKPWLKTGQAVMQRGFTSAEIPKFPDGYLDWAYLDANHTYAAVLQDLQLLAPKMKPDGIIAGHDFESGTTWAEQVNCGVVKAVEEFCANDGWRIRWIFADERRNASFWMERKG